MGRTTLGERSNGRGLRARAPVLARLAAAQNRAGDICWSCAARAFKVRADTLGSGANARAGWRPRSGDLRARLLMARSRFHGMHLPM
jgi:hypothetical protein